LNFQIHPTIYDLAPSITRVICRRFRGFVDREDVLQECYLWAMSRSVQFDEMLNEPNALQRVINEKKIAWQMKRVAERYARREKATKSGYQSGDEAFYETTVIAQLLPHIITSIVDNTVLEQAQNLINDGTPRKPSVPAEGGNLLAILIDIKKAYLKLDNNDQSMLRMRYHENQTLEQMALVFSCAISTIDRRVGAALRRLQNNLGGESPYN
jgi:RNA polymerase sigma factor (sigma-70 family)